MRLIWTAVDQVLVSTMDKQLIIHRTNGEIYCCTVVPAQYYCCTVVPAQYYCCTVIPAQYHLKLNTRQYYIAYVLYEL